MADAGCAPTLQRRQAVPDRLQLLGRMANPVGELTDDPERHAAAERLRRVPGGPLVGDVGVVLELTRGLDQVDAPTPLTLGTLSAPRRGVQRRGELALAHRAAGLEVRLQPRLRSPPTETRLRSMHRKGRQPFPVGRGCDILVSP